MAGTLPLESVKPMPVTVTELMVSVAAPVDERVTDCVAGSFKMTLPNGTVVALTPSVGVDVLSCRANDFDMPLAEAVSVAV